MFSVSRAKGETGLHSCDCNQSISQLNTVGERMLFDQGDCCGTDSFGKRQDPELQLAKRLPDLAGFEPGSGALKKLHEGHDG